jgi:hypothetical protein
MPGIRRIQFFQLAISFFALMILLLSVSAAHLGSTRLAGFGWDQTPAATTTVAAAPATGDGFGWD